MITALMAKNSTYLMIIVTLINANPCNDKELPFRNDLKILFRLKFWPMSVKYLDLVRLLTGEETFRSSCSQVGSSIRFWSVTDKSFENEIHFFLKWSIVFSPKMNQRLIIFTKRKANVRVTPDICTSRSLTDSWYVILWKL